MAFRSPARLLAPLALAAAALAVIVVVATSGTPSSSDAARTTRTAVSRTHHPAKKARARSYVVKPGDNLSAIAQRTGVSLDTLQQLNPNVDPQALRAGQRLKLSP